MKSTPIEVQVLMERNKRSVSVNQSYIKLSKNKKIKKNHDKTCILYKYCGGYLLFELNDNREPVQIWRDFNRGKFPLKTQYAPLSQFIQKIQQFAPNTIYTNDAEPLKNLNLVYRLQAFFIPIHELLQELLIVNDKNCDDHTNSLQHNFVNLPNFESVRELDPKITYKEYKQIYCAF